jgi:hypothetical protein
MPERDRERYPTAHDLPTITTRVTPELAARLLVAARQRGLTRTDFIAGLLEREMEAIEIGLTGLALREGLEQEEQAEQRRRARLKALRVDARKQQRELRRAAAAR